MAPPHLASATVACSRAYSEARDIARLRLRDDDNGGYYCYNDDDDAEDAGSFVGSTFHPALTATAGRSPLLAVYWRRCRVLPRQPLRPSIIAIIEARGEATVSLRTAHLRISGRSRPSYFQGHGWVSQKLRWHTPFTLYDNRDARFSHQVSRAATATTGSPTRILVAAMADCGQPERRIVGPSARLPAEDEALNWAPAIVNEAGIV